ncbi:MAG: GAF domain-containing protein [Bacteroidota bacterium]
METFKQNKILATAALVLIFVFSFLIFVVVYNLSREAETSNSRIFALVFIFLNIVLAVFLYSLFLIVTGKKLAVIEKAKKEAQEAEMEEKKEQEEKEKREQEKIKAREEAEIKKSVQNLMIGKKGNEGTDKYLERILAKLAGEFNFVQGLYYARKPGKDEFALTAEYAYFSEEKPEPFKLGETLPGQAAKNKQILFIDELPENYTVILSGLGEGSPEQLIIIPLVRDNETFGVIEMASFKKVLNDKEKRILREFAISLSDKLDNKEKK